ncbi:hypothetical protein COLO4_20505 [Corchorus olitorius]|uniref:Uncharacterized protein n=1 Tax=Corchorus olitorius TaxID=93759 RepID=A0A1R3IZK1_9ROSI|nr:hypothetical protein COLO4_20505 [Corchorus olitorius]
MLKYEGGRSIGRHTLKISREATEREAKKMRVADGSCQNKDGKGLSIGVVEDDKIRRLRWQNELAKEMRNPLSQVNFTFCKCTWRFA